MSGIDRVSGIDRRGALRLIGAVGAAGLTAGWAAGCGVARDDSPPGEQLHESHVRIGLLVPESGGFKAIGDDIVNGLRRYLAANGNRLGGHPYVLHQEDEGSSADEALAGLERLLGQDVHAVVGVATSAALLAVGPAVEAANVPLLGANASPQQLQGVPYVWRTSFVNQEPGLALGGYMATVVNGTVAMVAQDDPTGTDPIDGLQEAFAQANSSDQLTEPVLTEPDGQPGGGFFGPALQQIREQNPAGVFAAYAGAAAIEFVREYLAAGLAPEQLYGPADLTEGAVLEALGAEAVGIRTAANYAPDLTTSANQSFTVAYRNEFGRAPTTYAVAGYDAAAALDRAVRLTSGNPGRREINQMLGEIGLIDSPRGQWQFNQGRTPTQKWYLRQVSADGPVLGNVVLSELGTFG